MTARSILFSAPMVRALLEGRKTQTRRILDASCKNPPACNLYGTLTARDENDQLYRWPRTYSVGDFLYVREAWHAARSLDDTPPREIPRDAEIEHAATARSYAEIGLKGKLRPSMFMPRWASRLTLIVTDVRVERLQEITNEDCIAEGIPVHPNENAPRVGPVQNASAHRHGLISHYGAEYRQLWDSLNAKPRPRYGDDGKVTHYESFPWGGESGTETYRGKPHHIHANPWVAAYTFTVHQLNVDQITGGWHG